MNLLMNNALGLAAQAGDNEVADQASKWLTYVKELAAEHGPGILLGLVILIVGWIIAKMVKGIVKKAMRRAKLDDTLVGFLSSIVYFALMALVVISALGKWGVNTSSFAAIIAAAGLAIGFALQGSLGNFAAGVMLIVLRPFKKGDFVEVAGMMGSVQEVAIFATTLITPDNKTVIVPNGSITSSNITNYSTQPTRRVDLVFGIAYDDDIKLAKEILEKILAEDERVLKDPAPTIAVGELGDSSVNLLCRPWVNSADYWAVHNGLLEVVKIKFDAAGISIPFPQRDVHMHQVA